MKQLTGKDRLERLYKRLKTNYPDADIRFEDKSSGIRGKYFKVSYWFNVMGKDSQICDAIWGEGSYGYEENLLEFYGWSEPIGHITELKAYNLFKKEIEAKKGRK